MFRHLVVMAAAVASTLAQAAPALDSPAPDRKAECAETRQSEIARDTESVARLDALVEQVPPDEDKYLGVEYGAADDAQSRARLQTLRLRPYYPAWALHRELKALADALARVDAPPVGESKEAYQIKTAAFALVQVAAASRALSTYVAYDQQRASHVLSEDDVSQHTFSLGTMGAGLAWYIGCTVDAMKAPIAPRGRPSAIHRTRAHGAYGAPRRRTTSAAVPADPTFWMRGAR